MDRSNSPHIWTRLDYAALALLVSALFLFFIIGMQLAGLAILICSVMAWTRPFDENKANGKPALEPKGRAIVASVMGLLGVTLVATHTEDESSFFDLQSSGNISSSFGSSDAFIRCKEEVEARVMHPSSVDMAAFTADFNEDTDGRSTLNSTFTAKNSFNLESEFRVRCLFENGTLVDVSISER